MGSAASLSITSYAGIQAQNAGLFVSAGHGAHATRRLESFELIFVRSGVLRLFEEQRQFDVRRDQTLLLWPGRTHGGIGGFPRDLQFYWVHFRYRSPSSSRRPCPLCGLVEPIEVPQVTTLASPERLADLYRRFIDDQETGLLTPREAALLILLMLSEVARAGATERALSEPPLVAAVRQFIRAHYNEPISTTTIAQAFRYNPDYLGRAFREATGESIVRCINRRRIKEARALLASDAMRVSEVAYACGFQDPGYFRRVFRSLCGMTPRQYRSLYTHQHINTH